MGDDDRREDAVQAALATNDSHHLSWLEPIYFRHAKEVMRTAYRITGSAEDAEDVLQTVFMRLARREEMPDLAAGAGGYLHRAATNAALDVVRARAARHTTPLAAVADPAAGDADSAADSRHVSAELRDRLRASLAGLNPRNAAMFTLKYFEDLDNNRIAELFATTPGTVAVTLHRVRARLKTDLAPYLTPHLNPQLNPMGGSR